jgi:hypothetical protein
MHCEEDVGTQGNIMLHEEEEEDEEEKCNQDERVIGLQHQEIGVAQSPKCFYRGKSVHERDNC